MLASLSLVFGTLLAIIVLAVTHRRSMGGAQALTPTILGWCTLAFGLVAVAALALALFGPPTARIRWVSLLWPNLSIALAAAVLVGVGALMRRDRHWPTWVGLAAGLVPAAFWTIFAAGHILGFGD